MPHALGEKARAEMVARFFVVFRDRGYEGTSLADLSQASGLGKSSLYHHFPRGKQQMAEAVLEQGRSFIQGAVVNVTQSAQPLKAKVRKIAAVLDQLYAGGHNPCLLGRLATANVGTAGHRIVKEIFTIWTEAVATLARESGMSATDAHHFGEDWIAQVQGSLILYAAEGHGRAFERAMNQLSKLVR